MNCATCSPRWQVDFAGEDGSFLCVAILSPGLRDEPSSPPNARLLESALGSGNLCPPFR